MPHWVGHEVLFKHVKLKLFYRDFCLADEGLYCLHMSHKKTLGLYGLISWRHGNLKKILVCNDIHNIKLHVNVSEQCILCTINLAIVLYA